MLARSCVECVIFDFGNGGFVSFRHVGDVAASPRPSTTTSASPASSACLQLLAHLSIDEVAKEPQW